MKHKLQDLYDSEINFSISVFWDAGFDWKLGDDLNGICESGNSDTFDEAVESLVEAARKHFPKSDFARNYITSWYPGCQTHE